MRDLLAKIESIVLKFDHRISHWLSVDVVKLSYLGLFMQLRVVENVDDLPSIRI